MRLFYIKNIIIIFCLLTANEVFSQDVLLPSRFIEEGNLTETSNVESNVLASFKEGQKCEVLGYYGNNVYKVLFKGFSGFVGDEYLSISEEMMDLFYDYEEKERLRVIKEDNDRKKRIADVVNKIKLKEKRIQDSIRAIEEAKERIIKYRQDSIVQVKADLLRKQIEAERLAKEQALVLQEKRHQDSIVQIKADLLRKQIEAERLAKEQALVLQEKRRQDSIVQVKADLLRKQIEAERLVKEQALARLEKYRQDSIVQVKADLLKKQIEAERLAKEQTLVLQEKRRQDSIVQVKADLLRKQIEAERLVKEQALVRLEKYRQDSIAQVKADLLRKQIEAEQLAKEQALALLEKRRQDSLSIAQVKGDLLKKQKEDEALRRERIREKIRNKEVELKQQKRKDSIYKNQLMLERGADISNKAKTKETCLYLINEYDKFYNVTTIRTEPYTIGEGLTVELYRQGRKVNIFFNFSGDLGCASYLPNQRSTVKVTLENNQTVAFYHSWDIECGEFLFKGNLSTSKVSNLKKSPIKSILLKGTKGSFEVDNILYKEFFIDKLKCIE